MTDRITDVLVGDHRRLGELLRGAEGGDGDSYKLFRGALLRHIGIEEKIVLPALRARGCEVPQTAQIRRDHSALVAMLVPSPTVDILSQLSALLALHDPLEEDDGGLYPLADEWIIDVGDILTRIEHAPIPPLAPHFDGPRAFAAIETLLARARERRSGS